MICKYIQQVLLGLKYLHGEGIIHRDIKGDNVLLTKERVVKLADFGIAGSLDDISENDIAGTPYWMAPEIISLSGASYKSDIWSVGCMVVELLTGKPPYYDLPKMTALYKIVTDEHPPFPPKISGACLDFLKSCFKKDPEVIRSEEQLLSHAWITGKVSISQLSENKINKKKDNKVDNKVETNIKTKLDLNAKLNKFKKDDIDISAFEEEKSDTIVKGEEIAKKIKEMQSKEKKKSNLSS